jgi:hypothetical protein
VVLYEAARQRRVAGPSTALLQKAAPRSGQKGLGS